MSIVLFKVYCSMLDNVTMFACDRTCTTVSWTFRIFYEKVVHFKL